MAASLLALLDDITTMTKVAAGKTAGVLGDDLALNAQQVAGVDPERELPVVWAVAKGSLVNKAILVPTAVGLSALAPWAIVPLLMLGGLFLCYEGVEKVFHKFLGHVGEEQTAHDALAIALVDPTQDLMAAERTKIRGAIRTDFILSAEIIIIALGTVAHVSLPVRMLVLTLIALVMTVGVYGLVAGIVKLDDFGLGLARRGGFLQPLGQAIVASVPWLMTALSIAGTAAMFLVGGGILAHGIPGAEHLISTWAAHAAPVSGLATLILEAGLGFVAGAMAVGSWKAIERVRRT